MPEHKKLEKKDNLICRTDRDMLDDKEIDGYNQCHTELDAWWQDYHSTEISKAREDERRKLAERLEKDWKDGALLIKLRDLISELRGGE